MGSQGAKTLRRIAVTALMLAACGGADTASSTTAVRSPITTTVAPRATVPAPTTAATAAPTEPTVPVTTVAEVLPESVGTPGDPAVAQLPTGATRYYFAGEDLTTSLRKNVLGDEQVLFYDVYPPSGLASGLTAIYVHGGSMDAGYANSPEAVAACRQLSSLGAWCVSVEYRRGFAGFGNMLSEAVEITADQGERYKRAASDARNDVLEAWFHLDGAAESLGIPRRYVLAGADSGSTIAGDIALATPGLPYEIAGAILSFGTHSGAVAGPTDFPVVLQGGLLDPIMPAYSNYLHFDADMPVVIGILNLYELLASNDSVVRLYLNAQEGHGYGGFQTGAGDISYFADAMQLFASADAAGASVQFRFLCDDANFGAAGPGATVDTVQFPDFRYEPYQTDLESGLSPALALQLHPLESDTCEV